MTTIIIIKLSFLLLTIASSTSFSYYVVGIADDHQQIARWLAATDNGRDLNHTNHSR